MIRISNKIKTLLAMLSFVQITSGCDATVQDIIIDTDPGVAGTVGTSGNAGRRCVKRSSQLSSR